MPVDAVLDELIATLRSSDRRAWPTPPPDGAPADSFTALEMLVALEEGTGIDVLEQLADTDCSVAELFAAIAAMPSEEDER